jgi:hypothetical protein
VYAERLEIFRDHGGQPLVILDHQHAFGHCDN